jgi:hypothetical protein
MENVLGALTIHVIQL